MTEPTSVTVPPESKKRRLLRRTAAVMGVIILGAIGSGVWETLMGPSLSWVRDGLLNLVSGGLQNQKTDIYERIARGPHEAGALGAELMLAFLYYIMACLSWLALRFALDYIRDKARTVDPEFSQRETWIERTAHVISNKSLPLTTRFRRIQILSYLALAPIAAFVLAVFFGVVKDVYVDEAVTSFRQMRALVSPYVSAQFLLERDSEFAQVRSRADYEAVMGRMAIVADAHHLRKPVFKPW